MKRLNILLIFLGIFLFVSPVYALEDERILEFRSDILINRDTSINIVEKIVFRPSTEVARHGLEWTIPYEYSVGAFKRPTQLEINSVSYYPLSSPNLGVVGPYSRVDENGWATLRIGDPDRYINQTYVYTIDYTLKYTGISYFDEHDEVYLNIIGPGWRIPIENATATLTLPDEITEVVCFTGPDGSTTQDCEINIEGNVLNVKPNSTLASYEGYTVAIKQPKGTFDDTTKEQIIAVILANIGILLPIPVGIFLFGFLMKRFRNERLTIIPQYKPEKDMDSLSSATLIKYAFSTKNISALLIEMAIKGYYTIREYEKNKYEFVKKDKDFSNEPKHIKNLLEAIFAYGDVVPIKKLKTFHLSSNQAFSLSRAYLKEKDALSSSREVIKTIVMIGSIMLITFTLSSGPFFILNAAFGWLLGILISLVLLFIFSLKIDIRSSVGNEMYHFLLGLKMYIETAEKERIKFHNDPKKYTEVFESLLPYAMIFGLEKKWAKQFEDIYSTPPDWYQGNFTTFNTIYFVNSLSSFNRGVGTQAAPPSYSSSGGYRSSGWSSGGSGFGGGGGSGGGGGGSGGGGW